jgi:hypothetical protein
LTVPSELPFSDSGPDGDLRLSLSDPRLWFDGIGKASNGIGNRSQREDLDGLASRQSFVISFIGSPARTLGVREGSKPNSRSWDSLSASQQFFATSRKEVVATTNASGGPHFFETIVT